MVEWLNSHVDTLVNVVLLLVSGFFSFILIVALVILKHRERIKEMEARVNHSIEPRLKALEESTGKVGELERGVKFLRENSNRIGMFDKVVTLMRELIQVLEYLRAHGTTFENSGDKYEQGKEGVIIPKVPTQEISNRRRLKSKARSKRVRKT